MEQEARWERAMGEEELVKLKYREDGEEELNWKVRVEGRTEGSLNPEEKLLRRSLLLTPDTAKQYYRWDKSGMDIIRVFSKGKDRVMRWKNVSTHGVKAMAKNIFIALFKQEFPELA